MKLILAILAKDQISHKDYRPVGTEATIQDHDSFSEGTIITADWTNQVKMEVGSVWGGEASVVEKSKKTPYISKVD